MPLRNLKVSKIITGVTSSIFVFKQWTKINTVKKQKNSHKKRFLFFYPTYPPLKKEKSENKTCSFFSFSSKPWDFDWTNPGFSLLHFSFLQIIFRRNILSDFRFLDHTHIQRQGTEQLDVPTLDVSPKTDCIGIFFMISCIYEHLLRKPYTGRETVSVNLSVYLTCGQRCTPQPQSKSS